MASPARTACRRYQLNQEEICRDQGSPSKMIAQLNIVKHNSRNLTRKILKGTVTEGRLIQRFNSVLMKHNALKPLI